MGHDQSLFWLTAGRKQYQIQVIKSTEAKPVETYFSTSKNEQKQISEMSLPQSTWERDIQHCHFNIFIFQCCEEPNVTDIKSMHITCGVLEPWPHIQFALQYLYKRQCHRRHKWFHSMRGDSDRDLDIMLHSPQWLRHLKFCYTDMTVQANTE